NVTGGAGGEWFGLADGGMLSGNIGGGSGTDPLTGDNGGRTFTLTGANSGTVSTILGGTFSSIENLTGGTGGDSFVFNNGGSLSGSIVGGSGTDSLTGDNTGRTFTLTGAGSGTVSTILGGTSRRVETLTGGTGSATFDAPPSATPTFPVHGAAPTPPASPGDTLNVDLTGTTNPQLHSTQPVPADGFAGSWTFGNRNPIS